VKLKDVVLPLSWWKIYKAWFPNIFFVVQQVVGIRKSHIETKKKFNVVGVLMSLQLYWLGVDNLDKFMMIMNN